MTNLPDVLRAGLAGSLAVTVANEVGHRVVSESPRVDVLGMRALVRGLRAAGAEPPEGRAVPLLALAGDLLLYGLYFGLVVGGRRRARLGRGLAAGLAMGAAAALLGPRLGLGPRQGYHWGRRLAMVLLYTGGGVAAGMT